ncbi:MAG: sulfotransferase domain-containing protein [Thiocapsa sp.]|uniref:sulfotransferase domain-containing protein n=1 Tax=Thiocapsa sp. TaxID=2024551 RepID=UPI001BD0AD0F|nr:sulfotransferase domain-containing protein [Thiocapsa sp.]QVL50312.1 MAG: sulfotransferase domain-containing protein [Thiocapsa sp.]
MLNVPNAMIIGAQKAGTTWLWDALAEHPEVSVPTSKENHFFGSSELYRKGLPWYLSHFDGLDGNKVILDAATTNFYDRVPYWHNAGRELKFDDELAPIPKLIVDAIPDVKVIVSLRNPVTRAISAYHHWMRRQFLLNPAENGRASPWLGLERTAQQFPKFRILEYGYYSKYLSAWREYLPEDRMLVLIFEDDIKADPQFGLKKTCDFLGIDASFSYTVDKSESNASWTWSRILLNYYTKPLMRWIHRGPIRWATDEWDPAKKMSIRESDLFFLRARYAGEKERVEALLGRSLESWRMD